MNNPNSGRTRRSVLRTSGLLAGSGVLGAGLGTASEHRETDDGTTSPRPGPDVLYEEPADAPQLGASSGWKADSLLVSGADAYVKGEYLFQDFIFDDNGARGNAEYPTDSDTYHYNAADLLEIRTKLVSDGIAYRITLNTMTEPDVAGIAIGIDTDRTTDTGTDDWGYGIGELGDLGLDHVLVTWGTGAELDGRSLDDDRVSVDLERNQIEVVVPLEPGEETWRHYAVTGLWDTGSNAFKQLQVEASEDEPGGGGSDEPPVFNVGFRAHTQEPNSGWRDSAQSDALANRDISPFHADIDFARLADNTTEYNVPETGVFSRLYASQYKLGDGIEPGAGYVSAPDENEPTRFVGRIQPYSVYVPDSYDPAEPTPLTVYLHGAGGNHTGQPDNLLRQLGEQRDAILVMPNGRGGNIPYRNESELDVFEALADVMARYNVDRERLTVSGYSMGGYGTLKFPLQYPDLFSKGFAIAPTPGNDPLEEETDDQPQYHELTRITDNLRTAQLLMWHGSNDPIVSPDEPTVFEQQLVEHGYRHEYDVFLGYDHLAFVVADEWGPGRDFLEGTAAERFPPRITYRAVPAFDDERFGLVHDEAHWVSGIDVADEAESGLVDVRSLAFGQAPPTIEEFQGEGDDPSPHVKRGVRWLETLQDPPAENALEIELEDVTEVTIWVEDAQLDTKEPIRLDVETTISTTVVLATRNQTEAISFPAGRSERTVTIHP